MVIEGGGVGVDLYRRRSWEDGEEKLGILEGKSDG